jgi:hypothetical protein
MTTLDQDSSQCCGDLSHDPELFFTLAWCDVAARYKPGLE